MALTLYIIAVGVPIVIGAFWLVSKQLEAEGKESTRRGTTRVNNGLDLHRPGFPSPDFRPDTGQSPSSRSPTLRSS
jgi:hypothetical protein